MAWVDIPDADIDADSPITVSLFTALRDNVAAFAAQDSGAPIMLGTLRAVTMITASTTHICTAETRATIAFLWGGGGGGGSVNGTSPDHGSGGCAGTMAFSYAARSGSDSLTATVGAGGAGSGSGNGATGGTTSLTGHTSASGGVGGIEGAISTVFKYDERGESGYGRGGALSTAAAANTAAGGGGGKTTFSSDIPGGTGGSGRMLILEF